MAKYVFEVEEYNTGNNTHHWRAVDTHNKKCINFLGNNDGNDTMFGEYPSIQKYLLDEYKIDIGLSYKLDENNPEIDGETRKCTWKFRDKNGNEVEIVDIPRTVFRVTS